MLEPVRRMLQSLCPSDMRGMQPLLNELACVVALFGYDGDLDFLGCFRMVMFIINHQ